MPGRLRSRHGIERQTMTHGNFPGTLPRAGFQGGARWQTACHFFTCGCRGLAVTAGVKGMFRCLPIRQSLSRWSEKGHRLPNRPVTGSSGFIGSHVVRHLPAVVLWESRIPRSRPLVAAPAAFGRKSRACPEHSRPRAAGLAGRHYHLDFLPMKLCAFHRAIILTAQP